MGEDGIPRPEFLSRQAAARAAVADAGFDGALIWSRTVVDMFGDVLYLTNHYSQQPHLGDEAGIGVARSHGVVVLPVEGPTTLITDVPWWREDLVVADDVRATVEVLDAVIDAVRAAGLTNGRLALVGASAMSAAAFIGLAERLPDATTVRADRLIEPLRMVKSPAEQRQIRRAAQAGNRTMDAIMSGVVGGGTEAEAVANGAREIISGGGVFYDAACGSGPWASEYTRARLPPVDASRRFEEGDMFHVDLYGSLGGYFFDFARSRCVGDDPSEGQAAVLDAVVECVEAICASIRSGVTAGDLYAIGARWLEESDLATRGHAGSESDMGFFPAFGHGLGLMWEGPWLAKGDPTVLEPGMYLSVEMFAGHPEVGGAMFEHNGLVTVDGFDVLTEARGPWT